MSEKEDQSVDGIRPILCVDNVAKSIGYYVDVLGFSLGFAWDDFQMKFLDEGEAGEVTFAQIEFGCALIMLSQKAQGQPGMWIHMDLNSAEKLTKLHEQWSQNGANIIEPPSVRPWGTLEMRIEDLDGNVFRVSSPPENTLN